MPYYIARHGAFRSLSGAALKVYVELRCRYTVRGDGRTNNNGELSLALEEGAKLLGLGKATVGRALKELEDAGFIAKMKQGQWYGRQATEWRITDLPCNGKPSTKDWEGRWKVRNSERGSELGHIASPIGPPRNPSPR